jgi:hypothetical protein
LANNPVDIIKVFQFGFDSVEVATRVQRAVATTIATTTSPAKKSNTEVFVFLVDAAVVQNVVASASVASSPASVFSLAAISALSAIMY